MISAEDVDTFFLDALRERLLESDDFEDFLDEEEAEQTARVQWSDQDSAALRQFPTNNGEARFDGQAIARFRC